MKARVLLVVVLGTVLLMLVAPRRSSAPRTEPPGPPPVAMPAVKPGPGIARRPPPPPAVVLPPPAESPPRREISLDDEPRSVPVEAIERYLERSRRDAASLLAAALVTDKGEAYLQEAAQRFPNDPRVQYMVLYRNLFPEQRREWLDRFMQSAPDNALPAYCSAREHFKAGDAAAGLRDLLEASQRAGYNDYSLATMQEVEQLYMESGSSALQAKVGAFLKAQRPHLSQFKQVGQDMLTLREQYRTAGDSASARAIEEMMLGLADRLTTGEGGRFLIDQLVGVAIERQLVDRLPPEGGVDLLGMTAAQRAEQLSAWRSGVKGAMPDLEVVLRQASEAELISYFDRVKTVGELEAMRWWQSRRGPP